MATVGEKIKARRNELQLSQRDLAERMGYSNHSTITRIEAGKVDLPQSRILQFAEALGTTPGYLMGWEQEPEELADVAARVLLDPDLLEMVEQYLNLSESDQYAARLFMASLSAKQKKTDARGVSRAIQIELKEDPILEVGKVSLLETE